MRRLLAFVWKFSIGVVLCLTPVTAILVLGWTGRAMRRTAVKAWHRQSGNTAKSFAAAMAAQEETAHLVKWPNWIISQRFSGTLSQAFAPAKPVRRRIRYLFAALLGSLRENFSLGLQMALNCWVITLPACLLWLLGWWAGWENSFNKGYEQAWVGPVTALTGVAIFIAAMIHLPLAQARQAVTGHWRSFYDFSLSHQLRRLGRLPALWLVVLYLVAGLLVTGAKIAPLGIGNYIDGLPQPLSDGQAELIRMGWPLAVAGLVFTLFVALHLVAARHYARKIASGIANGRLSAEVLLPVERRFLDRFGLTKSAEPVQRNIIVRSVAWSGASLGSVAVLLAMITGWGAFSFQLFFAQFLNHSWVAWLNLSLVQLPWMP